MNLNAIAKNYKLNVQRAYEYARDMREEHSREYKQTGDPAQAEARDNMHTVRDALYQIISDSEGVDNPYSR